MQAEPALPEPTRPDTALLSTDAVRLAGLVVAPAESLAWRESWSAPARLVLDPTETHSLGAIAEGRVTRVLARVGDRVHEGQVLVTVHSHEMIEALSALARAGAADAQAMSDSALAETTASRAERLYALKAASMADLERARAALARAASVRAETRAELTRARAVRSHLVGNGSVPPGVDEHDVLVRSPIAGTIVRLDAQPGAVVVVGAPLVSVSRTTSLVLQMQLPERALGVAGPDAPVVFTIPAFPRDRFEARVTRVAPTLDSATRTVTVQAQVLRGTERLRAEMFATADLLGPPNAPTLSVPAGAIQAFEADTVVITAREQPNGLVLEAVPIRVGRRTADRAEILTGIVAGTRVVIDGASIAKAELLRRRGGR
jgi:cobalt-zinc-cadmium efflux system membrane fusion protein